MTAGHKKLLYTFGKRCAILDYVSAGMDISPASRFAAFGRAFSFRRALFQDAAPPSIGFFVNPSRWIRDEIGRSAPTAAPPPPRRSFLYIAGGITPGPTKRGGPVGEDSSRLFVLRSFFLIFRGYSRFFDKKECHKFGRKNENYPPGGTQRDRQEHDRV